MQTAPKASFAYAVEATGDQQGRTMRIPVIIEDESAAAYFSDHNLLACALRPHGIPFPSPKLGVFVSLDHSMWFHAPFRCDEWLLYDMDSPALRSGRGLSFDQPSMPVATVPAFVAGVCIGV